MTAGGLGNGDRHNAQCARCTRTPAHDPGRARAGHWPAGGRADGLAVVAQGRDGRDNAQQCSLVFPQNDGWTYTTPAEGTPLNPNLLWGDWFLVRDERAIGDNLVHIEAANPPGTGQRLPVAQNDPNLPTNPDATGYTFYGRYMTTARGLSTVDQRAP